MKNENPTFRFNHNRTAVKEIFREFKGSRRQFENQAKINPFVLPY